MTNDAFLNLVFRTQDRGRHLLNRGAGPNEITSWSKKNKPYVLPSEYLSFLCQHNGMILFRSQNENVGNIKILPLSEVVYAPRLFFLDNTSCDEYYPPSCFALTDDPDSAQHLVYDTSAMIYYDVDPIGGMSDARVLGSSWESALDYIVARAGFDV